MNRTSDNGNGIDRAKTDWPSTAPLKTIASSSKRKHGVRSSQFNRRGYTLLELMLALGLSVVVITAIGVAIQTYVIALTKQQAMIERKQVVRSVFAMMGSDLRAGIQYKATDYGGLETMVQTMVTNMSAAAAAANPAAAPEEEEEGEEELIVDEEEVTFRPTLLGTDSVIMIDISRLPRLDQYNPLVAAADLAAQSPSDVKSLAYFVSLSKGGIEEEVNFSESRAPGGLYRREIDRAVADYMGDYSVIEQADQYTRLIAHEVVQMQFRYFDGEDWQTEWNSEDMEGFPIAIEIVLMIDSERSAAQTQSSTTLTNDTTETFRSVVYLPVTDRPPPEEE